MRWFVNEIAFRGRFATSAAFVTAFAELAKKRANSALVRERLICSRDMITCRVTDEHTVGDAIRGLGRPTQSVLLSWLAKQGPFLEDDRLAETDDYFEFAGHDVTDLGLGESARRIKASELSGVFSLAGDGEPNCAEDPLAVQHGLSEEVLGNYQVPNIWDLDQLEHRISAGLETPRSWEDLSNRSQQQFGNLAFMPECFAPVARLAFHPAAAERALSLFALMNEYATHLQPDGSRGARANELYDQHCTGDARLFSDEAEGNKRKFRSELTFRDPATGSGVFCPWHGKIKTEQFRIHFECPPAGSNQIRLFYFGPKITRR